MARFMVRVELHGGTSGDYDTLHAGMVKAGFTRTIRGNDGVSYHLPTAEYQVDTGNDLKHVHGIAQTVADSTQKRNGVLSCEYGNVRLSGLTAVR